jgi:hypothetical protein
MNAVNTEWHIYYTVYLWVMVIIPRLYMIILEIFNLSLKINLK